MPAQLAIAQPGSAIRAQHAVYVKHGSRRRQQTARLRSYAAKKLIEHVTQRVLLIQMVYQS